MNGDTFIMFLIAFTIGSILFDYIKNKTPQNKEQEPSVFCRDCKHCKIDNTTIGKYHNCLKHPIKMKLTPRDKIGYLVSGIEPSNETRYACCFDVRMRASSDSCGQRGRFYEKKG
jgi:hypothetical protein